MVQVRLGLHFSSSGARLFHPSSAPIPAQGFVRSGRQRHPVGQSSTTVVHRFRKAGVAGSNPAFGSIYGGLCARWRSARASAIFDIGSGECAGSRRQDPPFGHFPETKRAQDTSRYDGPWGGDCSPERYGAPRPVRRRPRGLHSALRSARSARACAANCRPLRGASDKIWREVRGNRPGCA